MAAEARIEATYASVSGSEFGDTRDPVGFVPVNDLSIPFTTFKNLPGPSRTKVDGGEINTDPGGLECHNKNAGSHNPNLSEPKSSFQDRLNQDIAGALRFSALPKLNMQTFDGNPLYYHQFIRGFDTLFKCVDDPESKFQYLIQCCRGIAYKVVQPCAKIESSKEAYNLARERLKKKFAGVQHIVDAHLAQVADGPHIKQDDVVSLDRLLVNMESCCLTLSSWNAKDRLNSPETLPKILDRLPTRLQHQFNEKCAELYSTQQEPAFEKLMNFLETRVTLAESRLGKRLMNRRKRTGTDVSATHISKATAIPKPQ